MDYRYYDPVGNSVSFGYEGNNYQSSVQIVFDTDNRLTIRAEPSSAGLERRFFYDSQNRMTSEGVGNSGSSGPIYITKCTYDAVGRKTGEIVQTDNVPPYVTIYSSSSTSYTLAGQKASETDGRGNTKFFSYNSRGLIATETLPDPNGT